MVEAVPASCHQRHHESASQEHRSRPLHHGQVATHVLQHGEVVEQLAYLVAPFHQPVLHLRLSVHRCCPVFPFPVRLARHLLDGLLHTRRGVWMQGALLLLLVKFIGTLHRLLHVLVALVNDFLYPRLLFQHQQRLFLVAVGHQQQVGGQFQTTVMTALTTLTRQVVAVLRIDDGL